MLATSDIWQRREATLSVAAPQSRARRALMTA
jgi:hypothetical protein